MALAERRVAGDWRRPRPYRLRRDRFRKAIVRRVASAARPYFVMSDQCAWHRAIGTPDETKCLIHRGLSTGYETIGSGCRASSGELGSGAVLTDGEAAAGFWYRRERLLGAGPRPGAPNQR